MDIESGFVVFFAACIAALWVLGRGDKPRPDREENASSHERGETAVNSILDGLYQLEG